MFELRTNGRYAHNRESGVLVEQMGKYGILYRIRQNLLVLPCQPLVTERDGTFTEQIILTPEMKWLFPYQDQVITSEEREEIRNNIRAAYAVLEPDSQVEFYGETVDRPE